MGEEFGSPSFAKSPNSTKSIGLLLPTWGQIFLFFMLEMISFRNQVCLAPLELAFLTTLMPPPYFSSSREMMWLPSCPPCWCRCRRASLIVFVFSPNLYLALIGLVTFIVAHENHDASLVKLMHSLGGVILMRSGKLYLSLYLDQVLGEVDHFLLEVFIFP